MISGDNTGKLLRSNKRLSRNLNVLENVYDYIKEGVILLEPNGKLFFSNNSAKKIFGITETSTKNSVFQILADFANSNFDGKSKNNTETREFELTYPEHRFVRVYTNKLEYNEGKLILLIVNDITNEKQSTEELIENEKLASVLKLASGIAHELGNPLNSISIHLQIAKRKLTRVSSEEDALKVIDSIDICASEVARLDGIIKNFLKALRPSHPDMRKLDPLMPVMESVKFLENELTNLGISVNFDVKQFLPSMMGDPNVLKQLYFNIIKNSMEAMGKGGVITVSSDFNDQNVMVSLADTGCGVDENEIMKMFDPYYTTKTNGHGLGMMIISEIVKSHNGSIKVQSKKNKGFKITLIFPRKDANMRGIPSK